MKIIEGLENARRGDVVLMAPFEGGMFKDSLYHGVILNLEPLILYPYSSGGQEYMPKRSSREATYWTCFVPRGVRQLLWARSFVCFILTWRMRKCNG